MTQSTIQQRKKILIVDVPGICKEFASLIHRWGYKVSIAYSTNIDSVLELISREKIDLIIAAKELTLKGPSLSDDWKKGDGMAVNTDFGMGVLNELRLKNNHLPVILLSTETLEKAEWMRDDNDNLDWVRMMKNSCRDHNVYDALKKAIEEFLGRGPAIHEWANVLVVSDEMETCLKLEDMLSAKGYYADHVTTEEAFQKLERDHYELLLLDFRPGSRVSGIDIVRSLRNKEKRPKIIVLSSIPRDELKSFLQKDGIVHLVDKYLDKSNCSIPGRLMNRVTSVMEQYD